MSFTAYFWVIHAGSVMQVGRLWLRGVKGIFLLVKALRTVRPSDPARSVADGEA